MTSEALLLGAVAVPAAAVLLAMPLARTAGARAGYALSALLAVGLVLLFLLLPRVLHEPVVVSHAWIPQLDAHARLRADGLSLLFAILSTAVGVVVLAYSPQYLSGGHALGRYYLSLTGFALAMLVLVLAGDGLLLYAAWEGTTLTSFALMRTRPRAIAPRRGRC